MYKLFIDKVEDLGITEGVRFWEVRCNVCKTSYKARASNVKHRSRTVCTSCSPLLRRTLEGGSKNHPLYVVWALIKRRVDNTEVKKFSRDYHYDGLQMDESWKDFKVFVHWAESSGYCKGLTIDRINPSEGYCPSNCRWTDLSTQAANKNVRKASKTGYAGVSHTGRPKTPFAARLVWKGKTVLQKRFKTLKEAVEARNAVVVSRNLPHPIQEYKEKNQ